MCEFLSYIEKGDEILFLTDAEVFSPHGREVLSFQDNDPLGHGAIRAYYNITGGEEHECRDFWNIENYPEAIQEILKDFDKNFGRMLTSGAFQNDDLRYIVAYGTEAYRDKASEQLLRQDPSNDDLCYIVRYGTEAYRDKAWEQLLKRGPSNSDLCWIVEYGTEAYREKAWEQLLRQTPSNGDLHWIVEYGTETYQEKASSLLK